MIFGKLAKSINIEDLYRFNSGWCKSGAQVRPKDTRTTKQLCTFIDGVAEKHPELKVFVEDLKKMNPKHLNLAADTMELATSHPLVASGMSVDMNIKRPLFNNKSLTQTLLKAFPKASKENPQALEFMQEVINNTDRKTIEYVLYQLTNVLDKPELAEHLNAVKPLVKEIADKTIGTGFPRYGFEDQEKFMEFIRFLVNTDNNPQKISLFSNLLDVINKCPANHVFSVDVGSFIKSKTPVEQVAKNLEILPEVANNAVRQNKTLNVVDFVNNNVNLY